MYSQHPDPAPAAAPIHAKSTKDAQICGSFTEVQDRVMSTGTEFLQNYGLMHFLALTSRQGLLCWLY